MYIFRWYSAHEPSWCSLSLVDSMRVPTCQNELRIAGISGAGIYKCNQLHLHLYQRIYNTCFEHLHPKLMLSCFPSLSKKNTIWAPGELRTGHWSLKLLEKHAGKQLQLPRLLGFDPEHCGFVDFLVGSCFLEANSQIIQCSMVNPQWMGIFWIFSMDVFHISTSASTFSTKQAMRFLDAYVIFEDNNIW